MWSNNSNRKTNINQVLYDNNIMQLEVFMNKIKTKISYYQSIKSSDGKGNSSGKLKAISDRKKKMAVLESQFDFQQIRIIETILELAKEKKPIKLANILEELQNSESFSYSIDYYIAPDKNNITSLYIKNQTLENISSEYERNIVFFIISVIDFLKYLEEDNYLISVEKDNNDEEVEHLNKDATNTYHKYDFGSSQIDNLIDTYDNKSFIPTFKLQNLRKFGYFDETHRQKKFENKMSKQMNRLTFWLVVFSFLSFLVSISGIFINVLRNQKVELINDSYKVQVVEQISNQTQEKEICESNSEENQEEKIQ